MDPTLSAFEADIANSEKDSWLPENSSGDAQLLPPPDVGLPPNYLL